MATLLKPNTPYGCFKEETGATEFELTGNVTVNNTTLVFPIGQYPATTLVARAYFDPKYKQLGILATGRVETLNSGFDWVNILVNGNLALYLASDQNDPECGYETISSYVTVDLLECPACGNLIEIFSSTGDDVCNDGVQWAVTLTPFG